MPTLVTNRANSSLGLPEPLRGILSPGAGIVVPHTVPELNQSAPGSLDGLELQAVEFSAYDPRFIKAWPMKVSSGLDGSAQADQVLMPAGHLPGMYGIYRHLMKRPGASAGTANLSHTWKDPRAGATSQGTSIAALTSNGPVNIGQGILIMSDGTAAVTTTLTFAGVTGSPVFDLSCQAYLIQAGFS
jgi:hypothetical protein